MAPISCSICIGRRVRRNVAGHRLRPRRRLERRAPGRRARTSGASLRGRIRDGVDRVPPHSRWRHFPAQRRGREDRDPMAAKARSDATVSIPSGSASGARRPAAISPPWPRSRRVACSRARRARSVERRPVRARCVRPDVVHDDGRGDGRGSGDAAAGRVGAGSAPPMVAGVVAGQGGRGNCRRQRRRRRRLRRASHMTLRPRPSRGWSVPPSRAFRRGSARPARSRTSRASAPPFLIMHGLADNSVPHGQSVLLYEALAAAGADVDAAADRRAAAHVLQPHQPRRARGPVPHGRSDASARWEGADRRRSCRRVRRGARVLRRAPQGAANALTNGSARSLAALRRAG